LTDEDQQKILRDLIREQQQRITSLAHISLIMRDCPQRVDAGQHSWAESEHLAKTP
jgi:hypothetical protein